MWLNQIQNPNQTRGNMKRYYTKLLDPNEFFLYCTFHTQFLRLLLLKKVAACSTVYKNTSLDKYNRNHSLGECRPTSIRNAHSSVKSSLLSRPGNALRILSCRLRFEMVELLLQNWCKRIQTRSIHDSLNLCLNADHRVSH